MATKFYNLKELIDEQLGRVEEKNLKQTKKILIEYTSPEPGHLAPDPEARGYYKVTIETFNGTKWVV
jgi:hypothetical protein